MGSSSSSEGPGALRAPGNTPRGLFGLQRGAGTATGRDATRLAGERPLQAAAGPRGAVACAALAKCGRDCVKVVAALGTLECEGRSIGDG